MKTFTEIDEMIIEHTDYGGFVKRDDLTFAIQDYALDVEAETRRRIREVLACEIECTLFETQILPALLIAEKPE